MRREAFAARLGLDGKPSAWTQTYYSLQHLFSPPSPPGQGVVWRNWACPTGRAAERKEISGPGAPSPPPSFHARATLYASTAGQMGEVGTSYSRQGLPPRFLCICATTNHGTGVQADASFPPTRGLLVARVQEEPCPPTSVGRQPVLYLTRGAGSEICARV